MNRPVPHNVGTASQYGSGGFWKVLEGSGRFWRVPFLKLIRLYKGGKEFSGQLSDG
jgi:hypothetical protein